MRRDEGDYGGREVSAVLYFRAIRLPFGAGEQMTNRHAQGLDLLPWGDDLELLRDVNQFGQGRDV
jgi:hypothetical protein